MKVLINLECLSGYHWWSKVKSLYSRVQQVDLEVQQVDLVIQGQLVTPQKLTCYNKGATS